jgi:hypothetical protein
MTCMYELHKQMTNTNIQFLRQKLYTYSQFTIRKSKLQHNKDQK